MFLEKFLLISFISFSQFLQFFSPSEIRVEKPIIYFSNLPDTFNGLRILHLSDLHLREITKKEKEALEIIQKEKPDYIFITGDIVDWKTKDVNVCQEFFQEIAQNFSGKIFAVFGNHDHQNKNFKKLKEILIQNNITVLNNSSVKISKDKGEIYLIGIDDPTTHYDNLEKAINKVPEKSFKILLSHSIDILPKAKERKIDLILSGHFHGGQVNIPFLTDFLLSSKFGPYFKKYKAGLFKENSTYFYVSRGLGESVLPIRFNAPAEITLIELRK